MPDTQRRNTPTKKAVYKEEVLGKEVEIKFDIGQGEDQEFFAGQIWKVRSEQTLGLKWKKYSHYVVFTDGDEEWFDLGQEEAEGNLRWVLEGEEEEERFAVKQEEDSTPEESQIPIERPKKRILSSEEEGCLTQARGGNVALELGDEDEDVSNSPADIEIEIGPRRQSKKAKDSRPKAGSTVPLERRPEKKARTTSYKKDTGKKGAVPGSRGGGGKRRVDNRFDLDDFEHWLREISMQNR